MGKLPPKYKGQSNKYTLLEDIIGTEPLKGTYEERKKVTREIEKQEAIRQEWLIKEAEALIKRKREELNKRLEDTEKLEMINTQMSFVLYNMLEPAAYTFLDYLRVNEPEVCSAIIKIIFPDSDMVRLDEYVRLINRKGRPKRQIQYVYLQKLYRKIKNIKPTIQIEEDGKRVDISEKFSPRKVA